MSITEDVCYVVNKMIDKFKLDLSKEEAIKLKEGLIHELTIKNGFPYFRGCVK